MNSPRATAWLLAALSGIGPSLHAGEELLPGEKCIFNTSLTRQETRWIKSSGLTGYTKATVAIAVPDSFKSSMSYPILVTCVTGDRYLGNIEEMDKYWPDAVRANWIVVTGWAYPHPNRDTKAYRRAVSVAALRHLQEIIPASEQWPVAVAGFSGGAKNSALIAAYLQEEGYRIIGLFIAGCNQDLATYAMKRISPDKTAFRNIPIFLSTGTSDKVSTIAQSKAVVSSLSKSGFTRIRLETYSGRHSLNREHIPVALDWFMQLANSNP